jgi:hypothetical protein
MFDVGTRRVPADDSPALVSQRVVSEKKPTVLAVCPPRSLFDFEWNASCQAPFTVLFYAREIAGMKDSGAIVRGFHILYLETRIFEMPFVRVQHSSSWVQDMDRLRYRIDNLSVFGFSLLDFLKCRR